MTAKIKRALIYRPTLQNLNGVTEPAKKAESGCNHPFIKVLISRAKGTG
jgi:hypothetical protein